MTKEQKAALEITSIFKATFGTDSGKKCIEHLEDVFVDREIARPNDDLLAIGIRQGEANVIKKIIKELKRKDI